MTKNILVILLSEMGSVVLAGPMFAQLRRTYPHATIHLLQLKKNQQVTRLLSLVDPDCMHGLDDSSGLRFIFGSLRTIFHLRKIKIDVVIDCELFSRVSALLAFACNAPIICGFTPHTNEGLYRGSFITRPISYNPYQHISKQFLVLVDAIVSNNVRPRNKESPLRDTPKESELSVHFEPQELTVYWNCVQRDFPILENRKLILLNIGGGLLPERAWPLDSYIELARRFCSKNYAVAVIGLKEDKTLAKKLLLRTNSSLCLDFTGYTRNLRELLMLMHSTPLLITNDGGPGHFAVLTPIQTIIFFGPETSRLYSPLGDRSTVLESGLACSPCLTAYNHRNTYCDGDNVCLKNISVDTVFSLAMTVLD
jgi:ADP-heptose:LPS heptosyltransferase